MAGALALAACSSSPEWMNLDAFKPAPQVDTVRFESEPPGAEAKTSNGQTCRTPCALALPVETPLTVTFTLNGYEPATETLEPLAQTSLPTVMRPNPVLVVLTPVPPPKPVKKRSKKPVAKKKPATQTQTTAKPAAMNEPPPPMTAAPAQPQAPAPWPSAPPNQ